MTTLFRRAWRITVDTIEFTGLDVRFRVEKTLKLQPNTCELAIWNLSPDHMGQLEQLAPRAGAKTTTGIPCRIEAGYEDSLSLIWLGDLRTVETTREGPDWVTTVSSGDGEKALQHARISVSYGPKTSLDVALRAMARALGVGEGNLSKVVAKLRQAGSAVYPAGKVLTGPVVRHLEDFARSADLEVSIQDGALQFTDRGKALAGTALKLSEETGLIESPSVDQKGVLHAKMLMIPDVRPGTLVVLEAARVKGQFKITKAEYSGDTAGADWGIEIEAERH